MCWVFQSGHQWISTLKSQVCVFFVFVRFQLKKRICLYKNVFVSKTGLCWVSVRTAFLIKMTKNLIRPSSAAEMPAPQGSGIPWRRFAYIMMQMMSKTLCPPIIQALIQYIKLIGPTMNSNDPIIYIWFQPSWTDRGLECCACHPQI
jgi:hypothetical protein